MPETVEDQLAELARAVHVPVPEGLEAAVMARVGSTPPRRGWHRWRRWVAGLLIGLVGAGVVASPVGASIREWFGLPGVSVATGGDPVTETPTVPPATGRADLERAADLVGFTPVVPDALGTPEHVEVSRDALVVSLSWTTRGRTVRLDQFRGDVDPLFWKTTVEAARVAVGLHEALWLPTAHRVEVVAADGTERTLPSRIAAPTLLWVDDDLTLRLEGDLDLDEATRIAESVP
ncbi:hypothetical protein GCM10023339_25910 [Alloalcanivorax gelatiniphagus]